MNRLNLTHALFLSALLHAFMLSPLHYWLQRGPEEEMIRELENVEFEIFQAPPREEFPLLLPAESESETEAAGSAADFLTQEGSSVALEEPSPAKQVPLWLPLQKEASLLEPLPVMEEKTLVKPVREKTSESLESQISLDELKESEQVKWDYCSRIRSLIENHARLPKSLAGQTISDVVKVEITLNRQGKLVDGTPKIIEYASSRFPEINQAALEAVVYAGKYFTPIPGRYPKDKITFELPIRFISGQDERQGGNE